MSAINVREALGESKPIKFEATRVPKTYVKKCAPSARECKRRADALTDIAEAVTQIGNDVPNEMPDELMASYNDIVTRLYELADLEFNLFRAYR